MVEKEAAMARPGERNSWERDHQSPRATDEKDANTTQKPKGGQDDWSLIEKRGLDVLEARICKTW